jgi:SAM-dependent methyltransferase
MSKTEDSRSPGIAWYDANADAVVERYEALSFPEVHNWLLYRLPERRDTTVLDIGAGSGRDAAWLAKRGHEVVAVEPSAALRRLGQEQHRHPRIRWINDRLPELSVVSRLGMSFDLILLSAVWMHVPPSSRARAFRKLITLLKPGGLLAVTLRQGPPDTERGMHEVSVDELRQLARAHGAWVEEANESPDRMGRDGVTWAEVAIRLPDDGTGALPLLRHIILNDDKSSTYKLALLRCLCRIADGADGMARYNSDDYVDLPFGLIALTWIRALQPLIARRLPQMPRHDGSTRGLGFAREGFQRLMELRVTAADLHVGMRFTGERAVALSKALRDCAANIAIMPAYYTTYPNGGPVFQARRTRAPANRQDVTIDEPYLWSFGTFRIPLDVWHALQRFSVWIEPSLETEWKRMMAMYLQRQNRRVERSVMEQALAWNEPQRDVRLARDRVAALREQGEPVYCVWSGNRLKSTTYEIDHCFPWTVWPCEDLWNLLPTTRTVNNQKRARIPDARTLHEAGERIPEWWQRAWLSNKATQLPERFRREATATLAGLAEPQVLDLEDVFSAVTLRRMRLKHDQQVPEWTWLRN